MKKSVAVIVIILILGGLSHGATPSLLFSKSEIAALKTRAESPKFKEEWKAYVSKANDLCDPNSKSYADPNRVTKGFEDLKLHDPDDRASFYGWRLQEQMETLGLVYFLTGEQKYREHGSKLLMSYVKEFSIERASKQKYAAVRGNMMRGFATGYDMFGESLTSEQRAVIFETAKGYIDDYLAEFENSETWWRPYHNYSGVCTGAAGCLALQLGDMDKELSRAYVARVVYVLKDWLWKGFDEQGAYFEGIEYASYGLANAIIFIDALNRSGGENLFDHPRFKQLVNWYSMSILPGEKMMDARNDSSYHNPGEILLKLASEQKNGVYNWFYYPEWEGSHERSFFLNFVWANNIKTISPAEAGMPLAEHFKGRGLCVWRTGWDINDVMFAIEAGQYYAVTHNQADKGHFTLYGFGYRWACDPGYGCNRDPEGRCQTVAHNCILIDGKGQGLSGGSYGTNGRILAYDNNDTYGYALSDCTEAYRNYITAENKLENCCGVSHFSMDMDHAYRHTFFVRKTGSTPAYVIILDDIAKDKAEHEYIWQMQSWPDLGIKVTDFNSAVIAPKDAKDENKKAKMFIFMDSFSAISLKQQDYKVTLDDHRNPSVYPRLRAYVKAVNPYFAAVLIPTDGSIKAPSVKFSQSPAETIISIEWSKRVDRIIWNKKDLKAKPQLIMLTNDKEIK